MRNQSPFVGLRGCLVVVAFCLAGVLEARATNISWTNTANGNWSNPLNWSPNQVPTATDDVTLGDVTMTLDIAATASNLTMSADGTVVGANSLVLTGALNWSGGAYEVPVYCNGGTVNDPYGLNGGQLINSGTLTWIPYPYTGGGSVISNASTGIINVTGDGTITLNEFGGASTFYNAGQLNGAGSIDDLFINTGTVTVSNGTLALEAGGTNFGLITVADGGALDVVGGNYYFTASSVIDGAGGFMVSGGTVNIGGELNVSGPWEISSGTANFTGTDATNGQTLTVSGGTANFTGVGPWAPGSLNISEGTLAGTAPVVAGPLNWTGGTISGIVYCNGGTVNNPHGIDGGQLINTGTLNWLPYPYVGNGSIISNAATGTINIPLNDDHITANDFGGAATFYNSGTVNMSGSSTGTMADTLINTGTLNISSGSLLLDNGCELTNGVVVFDVSGPTTYSKIKANGNVVLGGTLSPVFNGYAPSLGDSYSLITYGSESGGFTAYDLPTTVTWQPFYSAGAFGLNVIGTNAPYVSVGASQPVIGANGFNLLLIGPIGSNYVIGASTNLKTWVQFTNFISTNSSTIVTDPAELQNSHRFYRWAILSP
jgi:hypothetical protein